MPGFDGTGPFGNPNWSCRRMCGRGFGFRGRGFGRGLARTGWNAPAPASLELDKDEQIKILEAELNEIGEERAQIEKMLKELRK